MSKTLLATDSKITDDIKEFLKISKHGKYVEKIDGLTGSNLTIELYDVLDYDNSEKERKELELTDILINRTLKFIELSKQAIKEIYEEKHGIEKADQLKINVLIDNSENEISLTQATKEKHLYKLVKLKALVNGETSVLTRLAKAVYVCQNNHQFTIDIPSGYHIPPNKCQQDPNCTSRNLQLIPEESKPESYRRYYLKDINYEAHHSDSVTAQATDSFIDYIAIGDNVELIGYLSLEQDRKNNYYNVFHVLNARKLQEVSYDITEEDRRIYENWPNKEGFYSKIVNSIAPDIYKAELNKEGFLLSYVGASKWRNNQKHWINVLSVGDPATAKTNIAYWGAKTLPNIEAVSSKAGSSKGLFAGQKEQADGQKILEIGPLVRQSNKGLVCIDEFTRMADVFDILYTPMETGRFDSATVGGHASLEAETPIYATGNPKKTNKWDEDKSVLDNLQVLDPAMLSRFDLIIVSKDESDQATDKNIAESILGLNENEKDRDVFNENDLAKYLLFCKNIDPILTPGISKVIVEVFTDIRKQARVNMVHQEITNRLVGALTRITLAIARIHLHRETTEEDVSLARRLLENMLQQRGLKVSNANTYVDRVSQKVIVVLEESLGALLDHEIYNTLRERFPKEWDSILNDIGDSGPLRSENRRWRYVLENVEKSQLVEVSSRSPKKLRYIREQNQ